MNKREMIERALGQFFHQLPTFDWWEEMDEFYAPLADQAIVIECEVVHDIVAKWESDYRLWWGTEEDLPKEPYKEAPETSIIRQDSMGRLVISGHQGTPGKAIAIILPLEEE